MSSGCERRGVELIYRKVPTALRDRLIVQMLEEERRGEIDLSGLWVATTRRGRIEAECSRSH